MAGITNGFYSSDLKKFPDEYSLEGLSEDEIATIEEIRKKTSYEFNNYCRCSDSKRLLTASFDNVVKLWEYSTEGHQEIQSFHIYNGNLRYMQLSPDENIFYVGFADRTVQIWKKESGRFQKYKTLYAASEY
jgi:WD40 repeat protein